jgi:uncharacterized protein YndB with AHSA1/START domain
LLIRSKLPKCRTTEVAEIFKHNLTSMERKTKIHAEDGKQDLKITREFDLPLELLFKAYEEPNLVEQWMGTKVLKLENKKHGSYQFETTDPMGNKHGFNGAIHEFVPNQKITRTFEMENTRYPIQLEFLEFEKLTNDTSKLTIHIVYRSVVDRDQMLKLPFAQGINWAHNRLQDIVNNLK